MINKGAHCRLKKIVKNLRLNFGKVKKTEAQDKCWFLKNKVVLDNITAI